MFGCLVWVLDTQRQWIRMEWIGRMPGKLLLPTKWTPPWVFVPIRVAVMLSMELQESPGASPCWPAPPVCSQTPGCVHVSICGCGSHGRACDRGHVWIVYLDIHMALCSHESQCMWKHVFIRKCLFISHMCTGHVCICIAHGHMWSLRS